MGARRARVSAALLLVCAAAPLHAQETPPAPEKPVVDAPPDGHHRLKPGAPALPEFAGTLDDLAAKYPAVVRVAEYGRTKQGTPLRIASVSRTPPEHVRWEALLVAHLSGLRDRDESSLTLRIAAFLAEHAEEIPEGVAFRVIPDASPDATNRAGNATPADDDQDGATDEDGPDDLDGDGRIGWMRVPDAAGDFAADAKQDDPAKPAPAPERADAVAGKAPVWRMVPEGRDDDGDRLFNEDGPGGPDVSRNFPVSFEEHTPAAGRWTVSENESRALMDLLLADERIAVVYELGAADTFAAAPEWGGAWVKLPDDDTKLLEGLRAAHGKGVPEKRKPKAPGAGSLGATCWHQLGRLWLGRAPLGRIGAPWPATGSEWGQPKAFAWRKAEGPGVPAGAEVTPPDPADSYDLVHDGRAAADFLLLCAKERAAVSFAKTETSGSAGVLRIETRLVNSGRLPTHTRRGADVKGRRPLNVRVKLPAGAALSAGRPLVQVERLAGGSETEPFRWVVTGPSGATVTIECTGPDTGTTTLEVRIP